MCVFFAVGITHLFYARWGSFPSLSGTTSTFLFFNTFSVYVIIPLKRYWKFLLTTTEESSRKIFLDHSDQFDAVFDILHSPSLYHGELIGVTAVSIMWIFAHSGVRAVQPDQMMNFVTKEVVDEVFINLPSEDYNISDSVLGV